MRLPHSGTVWILTTQDADGHLRSRPVTVWATAGPNQLVVLTGPGSRKLDHIRSHPRITIAGTMDDRWWAAEGSAVVDEDPDTTAKALRAAGLPASTPAVSIRLTFDRILNWWLTGDGPGLSGTLCLRGLA